MIAILWFILNLALLSYFIYLCIKAIGLLKKNIGGGAAIIFVVGLFSIGGNCNGSANVSKEVTKFWKFNNDSLAAVQGVSSKRVVLHKNPLYSIILYITYGFDEQRKQPFPVSANSYINGLITGVKWEPTNINVETDSSGSIFEYEVSGKLERLLLNAVIQNNYENYTGIIDNLKK